MPGNEKVTWQMTSMTDNVQANIQSDRRRWRPRKWMVFLLLAAVAIGTLVVLQAGPPASDGYRPTDRTLEALELSKAGKKEQAFRIYLEEAKNGDRFAQFAVGAMLYHGHGTERNLEKAIPWYKKAAHQGDHGAEYALAHTYLTVETHKDVERGLEWLRHAADAGHPGALSLLGLVYEKGELVQSDKDKAMALYKKAAKKGGMAGLTNLARLTEQYDTLTNTRLDIYKWNYILEELGGHDLASNKRKALESRMGSWNIARARGRAELWLFLHGGKFKSRDSRE